jgi:hypothetical protein
MMQIWNKITESIPWHLYTSFNKFIAIGVMMAALFALLDPPGFMIDNEIIAATAEPFITPAKSVLFTKVEDTRLKPEMKNTKYMMAYENGKSSLRVCTDLTENAFEGLTTIDKKYRAWDSNYLQFFEVDTYISDCWVTNRTNVTEGNISYVEPGVTKVALNSGCSGSNNVSNEAKKLTWNGFAEDAGTCGQPSINENIFADPSDPGQGFLWHYMFNNEKSPTWFENPTNETDRNCTSTTCNTAKCKDGDCYDPDLTCTRYVRTAGCEAFYNSTDNFIRSSNKESCNYYVTPTYDQYGYCDCGWDRKIYMCNVAFNFRCDDVCKCNSASAYATTTAAPTSVTTTTQTHNLECGADYGEDYGCCGFEWKTIPAAKQCPAHKPKCTGYGGTTSSYGTCGDLVSGGNCGLLETCNCTEETKITRAEPQWMIDRIEMKDLDKCSAVLGKFNSVPCDQPYVWSYRIDNMTIVTLFGISIGLRLVYQALVFYWGFTEDNEAARIMFSNESFIVLYSISKFGLKKTNAALQKEYLQGWPWLLGFLDNAFTTVVAWMIIWGTHNTVEIELRVGRLTLLLLWIAGVQEMLNLLGKLKSTITKKQYYVTGKDRNIKLCGMKEDLWWPLQRPEQPETSYKVQVQPTVTSNYTGDGKTA